MTTSSRPIVAATKCHSHSLPSFQFDFNNLLDKMDPPLPSLIKTGDRVLVKPFLHYGQQNGSESRLVSHPVLIKSLVEAVKDCGGVVSIGDEGSKRFRGDTIQVGKEWLHDLGKTTGASLVSFAKTGAKSIRSGLSFPKSYLIARAVLEADVIVNCANFQHHQVFGMSGAVKNMFNAVVGNRQQLLHELFPDPADLAHVVVDICAIVKPAISFLDLTTVRDSRDDDFMMHPVGLLLAGRDPVALDAVATRAVGWDADTMPTITWGEKHGLGCMNLERIELSGLTWREVETIKLTKGRRVVAASESLYNKITRRINKTLLAPKPVIDRARCTNCGDCLRICPVQAIRFSACGSFAIKLPACAKCHCCVVACENEAITLQHVGVGKMVRVLLNRSVATQ